MPVKKTDYIELLEYAEEQGQFTLTELLSHLGYDKGTIIEKQLINQISKNQLFSGPSSNQFVDLYAAECNEGNEKGVQLSLSVDDSFRLLEHRKLEQARKESKKATRFATVAIIISIMTLSASIYFSWQAIELSKTSIVLAERVIASEAAESKEIKKLLKDIRSNTYKTYREIGRKPRRSNPPQTSGNLNSKVMDAATIIKKTALPTHQATAIPKVIKRAVKKR